MAGLDPAIHAFDQPKNVDARDKPGHDDISETVPQPRYFRPQAGNNDGTRRFSLHCGGAHRTSTGVVMHVWLALFLIVADGSAAFAQGHQGTSKEQQACSRDASRLCRKDLGNDGAVQACLQQNRSRLSAACDRVFKSHGM